MAKKVTAWVTVATAKSRSRKGVEYEVRMSRQLGTLYCTCPAWKFQRVPAGEHKACGHIDDFKAGRI